MYEDLSAEHIKKSDDDDENEDSGTWSFSYPSYSRFTLTGKTKSRLGRNHNRSNHPTGTREDSTRIKGNKITSVPAESQFNTDNSGFNSQGPKTPGMSWLQKDKLSSSDSFTPGSNLFRLSTNIHDSKLSVNDVGVDVSSQSNFLFSLKNESAQNSSCKRNLDFNTPFKFGESKQGSSVRELNELLQQNSFPKFKFIDDAKSDENKENKNVQNPEKLFCKESASQFLQNKSKQISKNDCPQFPTVEVTNNALKYLNSEKHKNIFLNEPNRPPPNVLFTDDQKQVEDNSSNTPLDLSSGKCLTQEIIQNGKELSSDLQKESMSEDEIVVKEKSSFDGLSSILPTFLAPINKNKGNECSAYSAVANFGQNVSLNGNPCLGMTPNDLAEPLQQVRNLENSCFSVSTKIKQNFKPESSKEVMNDKIKQINNLENTIQKHLSKVSHIPYLKKTNAEQNKKEPTENATAKKYDQLSAMVNHLPNWVKDDQSATQNKMSTTETDKFQHFNHSSESNLPKLKSGLRSINEFTSKNHSTEESLKASTLHYKTDESHSKLDASNLNPLASNILCSDIPIDGTVQENQEGNFHSLNQITPNQLSQDNIDSTSKSSQNQPPFDSRSQHFLAKTEESKEASCQRTVKESITSPQRLEAVNKEKLVAYDDSLQRTKKIPDTGQQKTYLAPQQSSDHRISNDFPHLKPDAPQSVNNRLMYPAIKKPQHFKMPAPNCLLTRSNSELYVNGKVYTTLSMLGRGGSSEVYQVLDQRSSKLMAVKCVDLSMVDKTIAEGYLNEIDLLSKLQGCTSVIKMFDHEFVEEYKMLYVVMEKGDTDLSQLIRDISKTKKISMSMIIYYWTEMLTAVRDIHERGIIHSDLKPANFLLVSGRLKLIDFGIASSQGDMTSVFKEVTTGTWNYMSPEAIKNNSASAKGFKITYKSDVWSLGCILYNLLYGKTPFSHITSTWSKLQAIADPNHQIQFPEVGAPLVLAEALQTCLHREPKSRPTVAELLALPYHACGDSRHLAPKIQAILPNEWWTKISHLFQEIKEENRNIDENPN